jgi:hypothetical protein
MIRFPDLDTLRLALTSGAIPPAIGDTSASAAFEDGGAVWVQPSKPLPRSALAELKRLGVQVDPKAQVEPDHPVCCWAQLLPLRRDSSTETPAGNTPVFFELAGAELPNLVGEILRLGNDRQSFRWLDDGEDARALLRVVGPPYYALLRALDRGRDDAGPRAYVEKAPRVLVEIGHTHPFLDRLQPPPGHLLLMRSPRRWTFLAEGKFRDIYEVLEFRLPTEPVRARDVEPPGRLTVSLRLARGSATDPAELWVIRDRAEDQLDALVQNADDRLLARLSFAVDGSPTADPPLVVLRVRPSKQSPPVLVVEGTGYRPYLRLANLFLPVGTRLHPPLRRDAVGRLLASDPSRVTWLAPQADGGFVPESLPEEAFRPLAQWVEYVLDHEHEALDAWVQSTRFDFEPFICRDDVGTPAEPEPKRGRATAPDKKPAAGRRDPQRADAPSTPLNSSASYVPDDPLPAIEPGAAARRLAELEARFLALDAPPDAGERPLLWREMATLNAALDRAGDATTCWANALWHVEGPPAAWLDAWAKAEEKASGRPIEDARGLDQLLADENPSAADLRVLAVALLRSNHGEAATPGLSERLDRLQHVLERHEKALPVRVAWIAWSALAALSRGDALTLARARDRLLERLHLDGLSRDLDLPGFFRFGTNASGERSLEIRAHLLQLHEEARAWVDRGNMTAPHTASLTDLAFAYGLAWLGETGACDTLRRSGLKITKKQDPILSWLGRAFDFRIQQALEGKPTAGPLPGKLLESLELLDRTQRYKVDRLREHSEILEPHERLDPYRHSHWRGKLHDEVTRELSEVVDLTDREALKDRMTRLLAIKHEGPKAAMLEARVLKTALDVTFRLGEPFARGLFGRVLPAVDRLEGLGAQAELLERAIQLAAHFDQMGHVRAFVARFDERLVASGDRVSTEIEPLLGQCFRGLRRLGMRDEIARLLDRLAEVILRGRDASPRALAAAGAAARTGAEALAWSKTLRLLLHVAAGWLYFGERERAWPVLDEARTHLLSAEVFTMERTWLARGYVRALGQAPIAQALLRLEELFRTLEGVHDTFTTVSHYSLSRYDVVEAMVLTLISEDFLLDETCRRWLEDDEYDVRRRIHRDVRASIGTAD